MREWNTDGRIEVDGRYSALVRWLARRGFLLAARVARGMGL